MSTKIKFDVKSGNQSIVKLTYDEIAEMQKQAEQLPPEEPTQLDRIEAQMMYTALMTDTLIEEG